MKVPRRARQGTLRGKINLQIWSQNGKRAFWIVTTVQEVRLQMLNNLDGK